ncbi:MAG: hypothetical protein IID28_14980 [Planctomycetes bacterium]|nr:hypothetical protein [Planctomycetota bacterium]
MIYLAEKKACRRFPGPAGGDLFGDVARNVQVFDALDFIAELTQHIPDARRHPLRAHRRAPAGPAARHVARVGRAPVRK